MALSGRFVPKGRARPSPSQGFWCSGDGFGVPVIERIQKWQILFPGDALGCRFSFADKLAGNHAAFVKERPPALSDLKE